MRLDRSLPGMALICAILALCACQYRDVGQMLWPDQYDPYFQLTREWSRRGVVRDGLESETQVVALFKSPQWRSAYVERYAHVFGLTAEERQKMQADQLKAGQEATEFVLAISSTYPENARLTHRLNQWRVLLQDGDTTSEPLEIRPLKVHASQLEAFYPDYHPWQRYYGVRFTKVSLEPISLLFTGPAGRFTLDWDKDQQSCVTP